MGGLGSVSGGEANHQDTGVYGKGGANIQSMPMSYHQSSGSLGTSPGKKKRAAPSQLPLPWT